MSGPVIDPERPAPERVDAVVVGAGFAGLYQLYRLRRLGLTTRVFETADGVGGTWFWNRYPGARCDVESMAYSYSFDPALEQEWEWSERYPAQPEILRYLEHVAERFDLRRHMTFATTVTSATWSDDAQRWRVETDGGEVVAARYLIMATGCLSVAKAPELPGAERFAGPIHHTAHWPHDGVDVSGLAIGVVGTGSSGIQSIPILARQAASTTVFQRTAAFSTPARNRPLTADEVARRKADYPRWRERLRRSRLGIDGARGEQSALEVSAAERHARYTAGWAEATLISVLSTYKDLLTDRRANDTAAEFVRGKIREIVRDPDVAEALSPHAYPYGAKRPCMDTDYYATFNLDSVHLVDLRTTPLIEITERGLRTTATEYPLDAIVFATGFDAMTGALARIDVRGRDGLPLTAVWADGPRTYLGLTVAGFPNLFTITGPGSPSVLSNMVVSIEQHVEWITDLIAYADERGISAIEATDDAVDGWVRHVADAGARTLYPEADSWYMGANVPGKPRVLLAYVGGVGAYREYCSGIADAGYPGLTLSAR